MNQFDEKMLFGEDDFKNALQEQILPWVQEKLVDGYFESFDRTRIHYHCAIHPEEKACIVISHGFCEFVSKYYEVMFYFYKMGYSIFLPEYRGHGFSDRFVDEIDKVHVNDYSEYVEDLHTFMEKVVCLQSITKEYLLYAHSMGGCIATLFLEEYPAYFKASVLSSPLHQMNFKQVPEWAVSLLTIWSSITGKNKEYAPGQHGFDKIPVYESSSCLSKARYDFIFEERMKEPHYSMYGGTYGWAKASIRAIRKLHRNAGKIQIPILLFQAGVDSMVKQGGQDAFVKETKNTAMVRYPDAKHEIFNAYAKDRVDSYKRIFEFFEFSNGR